MSRPGTNLKKWFENKDATVRYAPRHGGTYGYTDTLAVLYQRMSDILRMRNEIERIQHLYGILGGFRTRLRDEIVAKSAEERHVALHAHIAQVERAALRSEAQNAELLKEIDTRNQMAQDFQSANADPSRPIHIVETMKRSKMLFIKVFDLPEEVLDPEKMADFRLLVSSGAGSIRASLFTTDVPKCRDIINDCLRVPETRANWSFEQVTTVIVRLGSPNQQTVGHEEQIRTLQAEISRLQQEEVRAVDNAVQQSQDEEQRHNKAAEGTEGRLAEAREKIDLLQEERVQLRDQLRGAKEEKQALENQIVKLQHDVDAFQDRDHAPKVDAGKATNELQAQLQEVEGELESIKKELELEREKSATLQEEVDSARERSANVRNALQVTRTQLQETRAEWIQMLRGIVNVHGTDETIPEKILRPILFVAQHGVGGAPVSSDTVHLRSSSREQAVAVAKYYGPAVAEDGSFDVLRVLKALMHPITDLSEMIWFEQSIMPKVTKELGRSNGKASTYALMLYPALQEKLLIATGLSAAIAASALVELYMFFPFKEVAEWASYLHSMISEEGISTEPSMIKQAGFARLVSTLAPARDEVITLVGEHAIGGLVLQGKIKPEHSIPQILCTLLSDDSSVRLPRGSMHLMIEQDARRLIVIDDGRDECIFGFERFAGWSCCTAGFVVLHDNEGVILQCRASGDDFNWRTPQLLEYAQKSKRYARTVAFATVGATVERANDVLPVLEEKLERMAGTMETD